MEKKILNEKGRFLVRNIIKGLIFFGLLILSFHLFTQFIDQGQRQEWFGDIYGDPQLVITVYILSEIFFGIITPEIFMLWSFQTGNMGPYLLSLGILAVISYAAGFLNFSLGRYLQNKAFFQRLKEKYLKKYYALLQKHGAYLIIVASVSPLPFSAIALLAGITGTKRKKYVLYSLLRIVRFFVYGILIMKIKG